MYEEVYIYIYIYYTCICLKKCIYMLKCGRSRMLNGTCTTQYLLCTLVNQSGEQKHLWHQTYVKGL